MSRMTRDDWTVYSLLRTSIGKAAAEEYRHKLNAKYAKYGIGTPAYDWEWTIVKDLGIDGVLVKQFVPGPMSTEDRAAFEDDNRIEIPLSAFDCTGRPFTSWMAFYDIPGGVWVYHRIGIDI